MWGNIGGGTGENEAIPRLISAWTALPDLLPRVGPGMVIDWQQQHGMLVWQSPSFTSSPQNSSKLTDWFAVCVSDDFRRCWYN